MVLERNPHHFVIDSEVLSHQLGFANCLTYTQMVSCKSLSEECKIYMHVDYKCTHKSRGVINTNLGQYGRNIFQFTGVCLADKILLVTLG